MELLTTTEMAKVGALSDEEVTDHTVLEIRAVD